MINSIDSMLSELLGNFLNVSIHLNSALIYDRDGLLVASKTKGEELNEEDILGAIAGVIDTIMSRIGKEYNLGKYGTGSFETDNYRVIFAEAGYSSILICVTDFDITLNQLFPFLFLVAEKIFRIVEHNLYDGFTLSIPELVVPGIVSNSQLDNIDEHNITSSNIPMSVKFLKPKKKTLRYKVIILGDASVGKTTIISRFATSKFNEDYMPTLGISITEQEYCLVNSENSKIQFIIWDLAGQKFFQRARKSYISGAQAAFIVYDVTNRDSFNSVTEWHRETFEESSGIPFVLVANKIDLQNRAVSREDGMELSKQLKCSYIETSALTGKNIREAFQLLGVGLFFKKKEKKALDLE